MADEKVFPVRGIEWILLNLTQTMNKELLSVNQCVSSNFAGGGKKPRIEYVDLMKGICIIMVVAIHCDVMPDNVIHHLLSAFRIPLYFFLSGLFFKEYGGFSDFAVRKINKLIIPSIFFSFLFLILAIFVDRENLAPKNAALIMISGNRPIWFLRCLFFSNLLFFILHRFIRDKRVLFAACLAVGLAGCYASQVDIAASVSPQVQHVIRILRLFQPMTALPFFALGYTVKPYMTYDFPKSATVAVGCAALALLFLTGGYVYTSIYDNVYGSNPLFFYAGGISGIVCIVILCRAIKRIPLLTYLGRYSIVILGTHFIVLSILSMFIDSNLAVFIITVLSMFAIIPLFIGFFPQFTAQKDLFSLDTFCRQERKMNPDVRQ